LHCWEKGKQKKEALTAFFKGPTEKRRRKKDPGGNHLFFALLWLGKQGGRDEERNSIDRSTPGNHRPGRRRS